MKSLLSFIILVLCVSCTKQRPCECVLSDLPKFKVGDTVTVTYGHCKGMIGSVHGPIEWLPDSELYQYQVWSPVEGTHSTYRMCNVTEDHLQLQ